MRARNEREESFDCRISVHAKDSTEDGTVGALFKYRVIGGGVH